MKPSQRTILRRHCLNHFPELRIEAGFLDAKFVAGCSTRNCNATCCKQGVMLDISERDNIIAHADVVRRYMEPHQVRETSHWFSAEEPDPDFPSRRGVATQVRPTGCVFLDSKGRCVLQRAAMEEGMPKHALKPFFCFAYPVTIEDGELIIDDADFTERKQCCSTVERGELTVLDVCSDELEFMLGAEGLRELKELAASEQRMVPGSPIMPPSL